jgi:hypothetical protein
MDESHNHQPIYSRHTPASLRKTTAALALAASAVLPAAASSHREAPLITSTPKVDASDFYLFNSYETGRSNYVTVVANYLPLQDAYGGPNYFQLDPNALYEIHVDNTGDAVEDLTFQFRFQNTPRSFSLPVGPEGSQKTNSVPVLAVGQITAADQSALLVDQTYTVSLINGPRRTGTVTPLMHAGNAVFTKPQDNVGEKTFPDYNSYANAYVYEIDLPGTTNKAKLFVGQKKDPFIVNLGETFDLVNISTSPLGPVDANKDSLRYKNVTSLILELPKDFLRGTGDKGGIVGAWTTASLVHEGVTNQVSRLGSPLVNEVVIGVKDKDNFNASEPKNDLADFADYVTHPTLPAIIELLYGSAGAVAPTLFPRTDLVAAFVTGVDGLNANGGAGEMLRLNMDIPAVPKGAQNDLGVIAGDNAGFPNGRRPGDDVVDIALRVAMGKLIKLGLFGTPDQAPAGDVPFTDGAYVDSSMFMDHFPYLNPPLPGSPNEQSITIVPQTAGIVTGPFSSVPSTYDANTRTLTVAKPVGSAGFLRLKADGKVTLTNATTTATEITVQVK